MELVRDPARGSTSGDEVLLGAGIVGAGGRGLDDEYLQLEIAPGVRMRSPAGPSYACCSRSELADRGRRRRRARPPDRPGRPERPEDRSTDTDRDH